MKRYQIRKAKHFSRTYQYFVVWDTLKDAFIAGRLQKQNAKLIRDALNYQEENRYGGKKLLKRASDCLHK